MKPDIEIAQAASLHPIQKIALSLGILEDELEPYGRYKGKIALDSLDRLGNKPDGKLILVTAITPTPAGEGKTTNTIGLSQGLNHMGARSVVCLREPSMGPVFGLKGGATGGGYAQVAPMEEINLHFTGDIHAVGSANNLLCALLDNHLKQGNTLNIDPTRIAIRRVMDMNDRALRNVVVGLGGSADGVPREDHFDITVASEVMAILCLAKDMADLKERLSRMVVAYSYDKKPVTARDLQAVGAMATLLKDALKPNLVQTLENTPALIHGGPFANIAHGCSSLVATRLGLKLADYVVTEAGFGADLGAEKFFDIKCLAGGLRPDAVMLVVTIRALKMHGGVPKNELDRENLRAVEEGFPNLEKHIENIRQFGLPLLVTINRFPKDTEQEIELVRSRCKALGVDSALSTVVVEGGKGGLEMAQKILTLLKQEGNNFFTTLYPPELPLQEKIGAICHKIYGAEGVDYSPEALLRLKELQGSGYGILPVCMAKTQYSFTDDPARPGRPNGFRILIREVRLSAGAGFVVALAGKINTMPGLPKSPAAERIDIEGDGKIKGIF